MLQEHCHQASPERSLDYIVLSFRIRITGKYTEDNILSIIGEHSGDKIGNHTDDN
jgi:hypothetical protein